MYEKDFEKLNENSNNVNFDSKFNLIENYNYIICERILIKIFQKILRKNNFIFSISEIKFMFKDLLKFYVILCSENEFKNYSEFKEHLIYNLNLYIPNTEITYIKILNKNYLEFNFNFELVEIE